MKSLRLSHNVRLENLTIDRLVFTLMTLKDCSENYQLLSLLGKRMSRELKGADISLSRNPYNHSKLELEIKLPRKFWKAFETRAEVEHMFRSMAKIYKSQLDPFFK